MTVEVIVPWRSGCEHRQRALRWLCDRFDERLPDWRVVIATYERGPWVKAHAVMPAIEASDADVVIVHDADVWCDLTAMAAESVADGSAWAIPHGKVHRLTPKATAAVYAGAEPEGLPTAEPPYYGVSSGGIVAMRRDVALDVPLDDRFEGWGGEDHSWGWALNALHGPADRLAAPLYHLWHPPARRVSRKVGSHHSEMLRRRYRAARFDAVTMRQIVSEVPRTWL